MAGIEVTVGETKIDVAVSGGVGPTGSQGASGVVTVSAPITNSGTTSAASIGLSVGSGLAVTGGSLVLASHQHTIADTTGLQAALDGKAASSHTHTASQITDFTSAVIAAAPPTTNASLLTSGTLPDSRLSSNIARTSDVSSAVAALVNSSPAALDTLGELAAALGNDASFSTTVTNALAAKAPINNPTFTGTVIGVTKAMVGLGNVPNVDATARANHTGTQAIGTVSGLQTALDNKAAASHTHNGGQIEIFDGNGDGTTLSDGSYAASYLFMLNDDTVSAWEFLTDGKVFKPQNIIPGNQSYDFDIFGWDMNDSLVDIVGTISSAIQSRAYAEHNHGTISHDGRIGTTPGQIVVTTTGGALTTAATISASSVSGLATVATSGSAANLTGTLSASRLPTSGVTAGTYTSVTVDATGRVTAGSSPAVAYSSLSGVPSTFAPAAHTQAWSTITATPTSLSGYGITDAVGSSDSRLTNARTPTSHASTHGAAGSDPITVAASQVTGLSAVATSGSAADLSGNLNAARLPNTTVTAGSYGSASSVATFTVDAAGRLTAAGSTNIAIAAGAVSGLAAVATSGAYSSLTGTPSTLPPTAGSVTDASITSGGLSTSVLNWSAIQPWAANTAYAKGDLVEYLGRAYRRVSAGTSGATFSSTNWQATTPAEFVGSQITSGTVPIARLGTGSPSSSNYLRGDGSFAPAVASVDGNTGAVTVTKATVYEFTRSSAPSGATGSNGNWTWSLPSGAKILEVICIGGGGGGGSGRRGSATSTRFGGGGGGGAGGMIATINAASITTALSVSVGNGGAGGASRTTDDTDGASGSNGVQSSVSFNGSPWVLGINGAGGGGGTASAGLASGNDGVSPRTFAGTNGGAASATATGGTPGAATGFAGTGGGAGGSINASNTIFSPGSQRQASGTAGYFLQSPTNTGTLSAGAASTTGNATAGPDAPNYGSGGNGGGAATNGVGNSGAGGMGGDGYVRITVWS